MGKIQGPFTIKKGEPLPKVVQDAIKPYIPLDLSKALQKENKPKVIELNKEEVKSDGKNSL